MRYDMSVCFFFFFQAEDGIRDYKVTGVQTCALPIFEGRDITAVPAHRRTRLGIVRHFQIPQPFTSMTVGQNLALPLEDAAGARADRADVAPEAPENLSTLRPESKAHTRPPGPTQNEIRK